MSTSGIAIESNGCKISDKKKDIIMEQLWLTYYNDSLLKNGVITKEEHEQMRVMIKTRTSRLQRQAQMS